MSLIDDFVEYATQNRTRRYLLPVILSGALLGLVLLSFRVPTPYRTILKGILFLVFIGEIILFRKIKHRYSEKESPAG